LSAGDGDIAVHVVLLYDLPLELLVVAMVFRCEFPSSTVVTNPYVQPVSEDFLFVASNFSPSDWFT
jgi:hypothetical protein